MINKINQLFRFLVDTPKDAKGMLLWMIILKAAPFCLLHLLVDVIFIKQFPIQMKLYVVIIIYLLTVLFWSVIVTNEYKKNCT